MKKNMPAVLYGLTALVWALNGAINQVPVHFILAAVFMALSAMNLCQSKTEK